MSDNQDNGDDIKTDRELPDNGKQPMENSFLQPGSCRLGVLDQLRAHRKTINKVNQEDITKMTEKEIPKKVQRTTTQTLCNNDTIQKENINETSNPELKVVQQLLTKRKTIQEENKANIIKRKKVSTKMFSIPTHTLSQYEKIRQENINEQKQAIAALNADESSIEAAHFKEWVLKYIQSVKSDKPVNVFELDSLMEFLHNNRAPYTQVIKLKLCIL